MHYHSFLSVEGKERSGFVNKKEIEKEEVMSNDNTKKVGVNIQDIMQDQSKRIPIIKPKIDWVVDSDLNYRCPSCKKKDIAFIWDGRTLQRVKKNKGVDLSKINISGAETAAVVFIVICGNCGNVYCSRKVERHIKGEQENER